GSTMTISPSKDCWSRYDIDANFRVLAEWLGPGFLRAVTFPELQWPVARRNRASQISSRGVAAPRQSGRQPARASDPIDWMFSFYSHGPRSVQAWLPPHLRKKPRARPPPRLKPGADKAMRP